MEKVYTIECMKVAFNSYNEAEHWRRWYNHEYPNDYIDPTEIKWYYIFDTCADAIHWGNSVSEPEWQEELWISGLLQELNQMKL